MRHSFDNEQLVAARRERARRFQASTSLLAYPAVDAEDETEATLALAPEAKAEKKPKTAGEQAV